MGIDMANLCVVIQVSAFGSDVDTDGGDVWSIEWDTKHKYWRQEMKVSQQHPHSFLLACIGVSAHSSHEPMDTITNLKGLASLYLCVSLFSSIS